MLVMQKLFSLWSSSQGQIYQLMEVLLLQWRLIPLIGMVLRNVQNGGNIIDEGHGRKRRCSRRSSCVRHRSNKAQVLAKEVQEGHYGSGC